MPASHGIVPKFIRWIGFLTSSFNQISKRKKSQHDRQGNTGDSETADAEWSLLTKEKGRSADARPMKHAV